MTSTAQNGVAGTLRVVLRWFAADAPYPWFGFATRFKADELVVGTDFFKRFATKLKAGFAGQGTDTGLMASLDDVRSDRFDPDLVHPVIREFYEHTSRFDMNVEIWWNPLVKPFGVLYQWIIARQMRNLIIPLDNESLDDLDSWLELVDFESDGKPDVRCWVRVLKDSRVPVYVGAYKTYKSQVDGFGASYISVAFPIPLGTLTTVLTPLNWTGDGLTLTTMDPRSSEAGVYVVFPHQNSFSMAPAFGLSERFRLKAKGRKKPRIEVVHDCYWLGTRAFRMHYKIRHMRKRKPSTVNRCLDAAQSPEERLST